MDDWLAGYMDYTSVTNSPDIYRKWAGIAILAGAMERKCWIRTSIGVLYPNLYLILVGPPGVGKSVMLRLVREFWLSLKGLKVAPSSITKASLIDSLQNASRHIMRPNENPSTVHFNSLQIASSELGVLIPSYDTEFMHVLTDLYDCDVYSEKRRTKDINIEIKAPQLNLVAACTPNYLTSVMPEGAWDQGFASRILMIYSGEVKLVDLFSDEVHDDTAREALTKELIDRSSIYGKFSFSPEAAAAITEWRKNGEQPLPDHPKLFNYCTRRTAHLLKLSMVSSISRSRDLIIELDDVQRALDWLVEAEFYMPDIFRAMSGTSHSQLIEEVWYFIYKAYNKGKKEPVSQARVINFLQVRTPAHNVARVLEVMEQSGIIKRTLTATGNAYIPQGKDP
jgi:hypothetical protein